MPGAQSLHKPMSAPQVVPTAFYILHILQEKFQTLSFPKDTMTFTGSTLVMTAIGYMVIVAGAVVRQICATFINRAELVAMNLSV